MRKNKLGLFILPIVTLFGLSSCRFYTIDIGDNKNIKPTSITATAKKEFNVNDTVSINDFTVRVTYSNVTTKTVSDAYILDSYVDTSSAGSVDVNIGYTFNEVEVTTVSTITVKNGVTPSVTPISMTVEPNKTFYVDDIVSISDFSVTVTYSDNSSHFVSDAYITDSSVDTSSAGDVDVHFAYTYNEVTIYKTVAITINEDDPNPVYPLYITAEVQTNYFVGCTMTIDDFLVTAYYSDGTHDYVYDAYFYGTIDTSSTGHREVTIYYEYNGVVVETDVAFDIEEPPIYPKSFASITPIRDFYIGDTITISDFIVIVRFSDNSEEQVFDAYFLEDIDTSSVGEVLVYIGYYYNGPLNSTFYITINDYEPEVVPVSMEITASKEFYVGDVIYPSDFTVYVTFSDNNSWYVYDAYFLGTDHLDVITPGDYEVTIYFSYHGVEIHDSIEIYINPVVSVKSITIDYDYVSWPSSYYSTGNQFETGGFGYYRAAKGGTTYIRLFPSNDQYYETIPGTLYNVSPLRSIYSIYLTYYMSGSSSSNPKLYYGENSYFDGSMDIPYSSSVTTVEFTLNEFNVNYFQIACGGYTLSIQSVTINYLDQDTPHGSSYNYVDANFLQKRITPVTYSGSLVDGVSYVDVPTSVDFEHATILATKRYTYYSYEYVYNHPEVKSNATMTNPVDVSNYYLAFGCAPANYGKQKSVDPLRDGKELPSKSDVNSLFGSDARCISQYNRTDGYVNSVPYYGSIPTYYEFDIDLDGNYSTSARGVGRVVAFATGFNKPSYGTGSQPVCVFTDDHYATFREYNNYGGFFPAFNAELHLAGSVWSQPISYNYSSFSPATVILEDAIELDYSNCDFLNYGKLIGNYEELTVYLLNSGDLYLLEDELVMETEQVSGDLYFVFQSSGSDYGAYVIIDSVMGTISDPEVDPNDVLYSFDYYESVSSVTVSDAFNYIGSILIQDNYSAFNGVIPQGYSGSDYTYVDWYLVNGSETVGLNLYCVDEFDANGVRAYLYFGVYDSEECYDNTIQEEIPEELVNEAEHIQLLFGFSDDDVHLDEYSLYGHVLIEIPCDDLGTLVQNKVATFSITNDLIEMIYYYTYNNYEYYSVFYLGYTYEPSENAYYFFAFTGDVYKITVYDSDNIIVEIVD